MGFTTPCYIKKNTIELRVELQKLGYVFVPNGYDEWNIPIEECEYLNCSSCSINGHVFYYYIGRMCKPNLGVDCGDSERLFLSLAALRDDTDKDQVFVNGKGDWGIFRNYEYNSGMEYFYLPEDMDEKNYHKASVEEIIELFTK